MIEQAKSIGTQVVEGTYVRTEVDYSKFQKDCHQAYLVAKNQEILAEELSDHFELLRQNKDALLDRLAQERTQQFGIYKDEAVVMIGRQKVREVMEAYAIDSQLYIELSKTYILLAWLSARLGDSALVQEDYLHNASFYMMEATSMNLEADTPKATAFKDEYMTLFLESAGWLASNWPTGMLERLLHDDKVFPVKQLHLNDLEAKLRTSYFDTPMVLEKKTEQPERLLQLLVWHGRVAGLKRPILSFRQILAHMWKDLLAEKLTDEVAEVDMDDRLVEFLEDSNNIALYKNLRNRFHQISSRLRKRLACVYADHAEYKISDSLMEWLRKKNGRNPAVPKQEVLEYQDLLSNVPFSWDVRKTSSSPLSYVYTFRAPSELASLQSDWYFELEEQLMIAQQNNSYENELTVARLICDLLGDDPSVHRPLYEIDYTVKERLVAVHQYCLDLFASE